MDGESGGGGGGGGGDDDEELVRKIWDDSDRDSSSTGWRSSLGSSFQRRCEALWKVRLLTFREDDCGRGTRKGDIIRGTSAAIGLNSNNIIVIQRASGAVKDFVWICESIL